MISHFLHYVAAAVATNRATADYNAAPIHLPGSIGPGVAVIAGPCALPVDCKRCVLATELARE